MRYKRSPTMCRVQAADFYSNRDLRAHVLIEDRMADSSLQEVDVCYERDQRHLDLNADPGILEFEYISRGWTLAGGEGYMV